MTWNKARLLNDKKKLYIKRLISDSINRRKPGALRHLAFKANSRDEVDDAYRKLLKIGANIVSEPQIHPEYSETYYAVYFKDLENMKLCVILNN